MRQHKSVYVVYFEANIDIHRVSFCFTNPSSHRDIKPHNVMLDSRGHIILIDYGLSKQDVNNPTGVTTVPPTLLFFS